MASTVGAASAKSGAAKPEKEKPGGKSRKKLPEVQQQAFEKGLTPDEVKKLQPTLKKMSEGMKELDAIAKILRTSAAVQGNPKVKAAAAGFLRQYSRAGAVLDGTRATLAARDANLKAYESKLKAELEALDRELDALKAAVEEQHITDVLATIAAGILLADALTADYVVFDTAYDAVVIDITIEIEVYDVIAEVEVIEETEVWSEEAWVEYEEEYIELESDEWDVDLDGGYDLEDDAASDGADEGGGEANAGDAGADEGGEADAGDSADESGGEADAGDAGADEGGEADAGDAGADE